MSDSTVAQPQMRTGECAAMKLGDPSQIDTDRFDALSAPSLAKALGKHAAAESFCDSATMIGEALLRRLHTWRLLEGSDKAAELDGERDMMLIDVIADVELTLDLHRLQREAFQRRLYELIKEAGQ